MSPRPYGDGTPDSGTAGTRFTWGADERTTIRVIGVLSLLEIVLVEWAVPWLWLRVLAGVTGVATLVYVLLLERAVRRRPHVVDRQELVLRHGVRGEVVLPVSALRTVTLARASSDDGRPGVQRGELVLPSGGQTTVTVRLAEPVAVSVGRRTAEVTTARFSADDSSGLVSHLQSLVANRDR